MSAVIVEPASIEFGAIMPGTTGGQLAYVNNCPAAAEMTVSVVTGAATFSISRVVVSHWVTQAVDPSELPPHHGPPPRRPTPPPTERVVIEDRENDGTAPLPTRAGAILTVYVAATVAQFASGGDVNGEVVVMADGNSIAHLALHAFVGGVILTIEGGPVSVRQGESAGILMIARSVAGPDTDVSVSFLAGPGSTGLDLQSAGTHLASRQALSFPGTVSASPESPIGPHDGWVIAEAFGTLQGADDSRGRFLGVPLHVDVTPAHLSVGTPTDGRLPVNEGHSAMLAIDVWIGGGNGQVDVAFSGQHLPDGITMSPSTQWITAIDNADFLPNRPANNVDSHGMARGTINLAVAAGYLNGAPEEDVGITLDWQAYNGAQTGTVSAALAIFAPTAHMTPFDPSVNGYSFTNRWFFTNQDSETIRTYFGNTLDDVMSTCDALIAASLIGIAGITIAAVVEEVSPGLRNQIHDAILSAPPGAIGLCGGMAFSSLDFYLASRPLPGIALQTTQPDASTTAGGALRGYIWQRLLDSLGANGTRFMEYLVTLHILPGLVGGALGAIVGAAVGGSIGVAAAIAEGGAAGGPVGGVVGGIIGGVAGAIAGGDTIVIDLGGSKKLMQWSREEWTKLKAHLDAGEAWPIGLVGDNPNPFESHQIVAIGYDDRAGPEQISLYVYDNNVPKVRSTITMDLRGDTMQSSTDIRDSGALPSWMPLQGIICEKYAPNTPPPIA